MLNIDDRLIKETLPKIKPNGLAVLLAIAIHLNKDNTCFPSHDKLMKLTGLGSETVYNSLKCLKKEGLLLSSQSIDSKHKTFSRRTFTVNTDLISIFVTAKNANPLEEKPLTDLPQTAQPHTVEPHTANHETYPINHSLSINELEQLNNEGERTPPAPNHSTSKEEKKENGLVAPAENPETVKAETPPSPNSAPPPSPEKCFHCSGSGKIFNTRAGKRENCPACHGDGTVTFEVTAIASPTDLPGVTLVEAAPFTDENGKTWNDGTQVVQAASIPHRKNGRIEIPDEASAEILPWANGDGAETVKKWYSQAYRQHSPKDVETMVLRFSTVFLSSPTASTREMMETNPLSFFKRRFSKFVADQPSFDRMNAPKEGGSTRGQTGQAKTLTSNMRQL